MFRFFILPAFLWQTGGPNQPAALSIAFPIFTLLTIVLGSDGLMWVQPITDTLALVIAMAFFRHFKNSLSASDEQRAERIVKVYGQREEAPAQRLHLMDKKRKAYYELYTGTQWGQADNYELCLDSGKIGMKNCVDIIAEVYSGMKPSS